jgi:hypothetical protein
LYWLRGLYWHSQRFYWYRTLTASIGTLTASIGTLTASIGTLTASIGTVLSLPLLALYGLNHILTASIDILRASTTISMPLLALLLPLQALSHHVWPTSTISRPLLRTHSHSIHDTCSCSPCWILATSFAILTAFVDILTASTGTIMASTIVLRLRLQISGSLLYKHSHSSYNYFYGLYKYSHVL